MDTLELTKKLVEIETETPIKETEKFGPITEILDKEGIEYDFYSYEDVKTLIATIGDGEPHICLNGHMDVVPAGDSWTKTEPYQPKEIDGKLYGRGTSDMKGGLAASINAFLRLFRNQDFSGKVTLMVPGDEEQGGPRGSERYLEERNDFDYALIAEPTDMQLQIGFRGKCHLEVVLKGESTHASRPHLAENVLEQNMLRAIEHLKKLEWEEDSKLPDTTSVITQINTENPRNSLPGKVKLGMDIRTNTVTNTESIKQKISETIPEDIEYEVIINHVKPHVMVEDEEFLEKIDEAVEEVTGEKPDHTVEGGSSDGAHFSRHNIPSIEIGPEQEPIHGPDEYATIEYLEHVEEIFYRTAMKLTENDLN